MRSRVPFCAGVATLFIVFGVMAREGVSSLQQAPPSSPSVTSAERTEEYEFTATQRFCSNDTDIVLVLTLEGNISNDEWDKVKPDNFFVMATGRRCPVLVVNILAITTDSAGKQVTTYHRRAGFRFPRQELDMTVHLLERPGVKFTAEKAIKRSMR